MTRDALQVNGKRRANAVFHAFRVMGRGVLLPVRNLGEVTGTEEKTHAFD